MERRSFLASFGAGLGSFAGCLAPSSEGERRSDQPDHHLYLVNLDDDPRRVELTVVRRDADEAVVDGTYEIPEERGGEFRDVARWERTYDVTVTLDAGLSETFAWTTESCAGSELPGGSRNGGVRIESGATGFSFVTDSCDELLAGTGVATGPASRFEVGGLE